MLRRICRNRAVIVIEHDMEFVKQIAHKVTVMHQGKILAEGPMEKVQADPRVIETRAEVSYDGPQAGELGTALRDYPNSPTAIATPAVRTSLGEDLYVTLLASDPASQGAPEVAEYLAVMKKHYPAGDPNGAIRSLSSTDPTGPMDHTKVKIPPLGGHEVRTGGAPAGTSNR